LRAKQSSRCATRINTDTCFSIVYTHTQLTDAAHTINLQLLYSDSKPTPYIRNDIEFTNYIRNLLRSSARRAPNLSARHASAVWADDSSASDGCDSCFAAAWRTRSFTAVVEGDVGRPTLFGSIFLAAHDTASAPTLTGDSNSLSQESRRETCNHLFVVHQGAIPNLKTNRNGFFFIQEQENKGEFRVTYFRSCSKSSERSYIENRK